MELSWPIALLLTFSKPYENQYIPYVSGGSVQFVNTAAFPINNLTIMMAGINFLSSKICITTDQ